MDKLTTKISVQEKEISFLNQESGEFISLTDMAKYRNADEPFSIINNWMRSRNTIEFIGLWEKLNNPEFKPTDFDRFKNEAGSNYFVLSPQRWILATNAIGIISKSGRYGGTFAHIDIAFEFASWISSEFKLYLLTEFKRLKRNENSHQQLDWNLQRTIAKINHKIHTDSIRENLIPGEISTKQANFIYANEADLLNVALFGIISKHWREANPDKEGNIRDFATLEQLVVLSNLESINALLIAQGLTQSTRLLQLNKVAIAQMKSLVESNSMKRLR